MRGALLFLQQIVVDLAEVGIRFQVGEGGGKLSVDDFEDFGIEGGAARSEGMSEANELIVGRKVIGLQGGQRQKAAGGEEVLFYKRVRQGL